MAGIPPDQQEKYTAVLSLRERGAPTPPVRTRPQTPCDNGRETTSALHTGEQRRARATSGVLVARAL